MHIHNTNTTTYHSHHPMHPPSAFYGFSELATISMQQPLLSMAAHRQKLSCLSAQAFAAVVVAAAAVVELAVKMMMMMLVVE